MIQNKCISQLITERNLSKRLDAFKGVLKFGNNQNIYKSISSNNTGSVRDFSRNEDFKVDLPDIYKNTLQHQYHVIFLNTFKYYD